MYALTLHNPWAHAVANLGKFVENRTWLPPERVLGERIAIHAGKAPKPEAVREIRAMGFELCEHALHAGAIVCTARVAGWVRGKRDHHGVSQLMADVARESCWWNGPVGWILENVRVLPAPLVVSGAQGLWHVPPELVRVIDVVEGRK